MAQEHKNADQEILFKNAYSEETLLLQDPNQRSCNNIYNVYKKSPGTVVCRLAQLTNCGGQNKIRASTKSQFENNFK